MIHHKPTILYYDNGNPKKRTAIETSVRSLGISLVPVEPSQVLQTVGYLARIKGFPAKKISPLEMLPAISQEVMVMCHFTEELLNALLASMKTGMVPRVPLKAILTAQNSFWTFAQLFEELYEEHQHFYGEE